ncbi:MAG: hypothetical protein CMJ47_03520 [Planctomyces sp.]|nr:hypothetical protein [Planctomyces sp.]
MQPDLGAMLSRSNRPAEPIELRQTDPLEGNVGDSLLFSCLTRLARHNRKKSFNTRSRLLRTSLFHTLTA